jgi:hypothetical protein
MKFIINKEGTAGVGAGTEDTIFDWLIFCIFAIV